jgi:hypothetical protein
VRISYCVVGVAILVLRPCFVPLSLYPFVPMSPLIGCMGMIAAGASPFHARV